MLKRIGFGLLGMISFYFVGLFGSLWLLPFLTSNRHDPSVEAAMTGAFVFGPLMGLVGLVLGAIWARPKGPAKTAENEARPDRVH